jgi:DNA-binding CsgD family transcriptional regulator
MLYSVWPAAMVENEQLSSLIGAIYDASLDPGLWSDVLESIAGFVGGPASALVRHDVSAQSASFYYSWGDDPHYTRLYLDKYLKLNPTLPSMQLMAVGQVHSISTLIPFDEFRKTRIYLEWAKPQGYGDASIAVIEKSATALAHLTTPHRDLESPVNDDVRRRLRLLVPHVRRAVAIAGIIDLHKVEASMLADALDTITAGVFLVGEDAGIIRANASGRAMLEAGDVVKAIQNRLVTTDVHARRTLHEAVAGASVGDVALGPRGLAVPLTSRSTDRYVAHVLPLTAGARQRARATYAATATVFVHKATLDRPTPIEAIARHYQLTAAELRVLIALVEIGGVPEVAPVLGIAETTVRTHLRHLFEKTGTSRQADLVKIVAAFANPLVA